MLAIYPTGGWCLPEIKQMSQQESYVLDSLDVALLESRILSWLLG